MTAGFLHHTSLMDALTDDVPVDKIGELLEQGADIDEKNGSGSTVLITAIARGQFDVAHLLIDKGAKLDERNRFGLAALHIASIQGYTDIVRHLCDKGAGLDVPGQQERTALMEAEKHHHPETAKILQAAAARRAAEISHAAAALLQERFKRRAPRCKPQAA